MVTMVAMVTMDYLATNWLSTYAQWCIELVFMG